MRALRHMRARPRFEDHGNYLRGLGFTDIKLSEPELDALLAKWDQNACCDYLTRFNALNPAGVRVSGYVGSRFSILGSGPPIIIFDKPK